MKNEKQNQGIAYLVFDRATRLTLRECTLETENLHSSFCANAQR